MSQWLLHTRTRLRPRQGTTEQVVSDPAHPYTEALIGAALVPDGDGNVTVRTISGDPIDAADRPVGCPFAPRCPHALEVCESDVPVAREVAPGQLAACHLYSTGARDAYLHDRSAAR